jgi:alpha-1,2-mannosyltransferase
MSQGREAIIISIAQFRPEKDHPKQIRAFARALKNDLLPATVARSCKLVLIGSCRNSDDQQRVESLEALAREVCVAYTSSTFST